MKKRKSNLELLRIIAMFLIVLGHVTWQTDYSYKISENFLSVLLTQMLWNWWTAWCNHIYINFKLFSEFF